jgi:hypothetical protein
MILSVTGKICGELPRPARECFRPIERTLGIRELCLSVPSRMTPNYPRRAVPCKWFSLRTEGKKAPRRDSLGAADKYKSVCATGGWEDTVGLTLRHWPVERAKLPLRSGEGSSRYASGGANGRV